MKNLLHFLLREYVYIKIFCIRPNNYIHLIMQMYEYFSPKEVRQNYLSKHRAKSIQDVEIKTKCIIIQIIIGN